MLVSLVFLILCCVRGGRIDVPNAAAIKNTSYIAYQLNSYQVGVVAENGLEALSMFDSEDRSRIAKHVKRKSKDKDWPTGFHVFIHPYHSSLLHVISSLNHNTPITYYPRPQTKYEEFRLQIGSNLGTHRLIKRMHCLYTKQCTDATT